MISAFIAALSGALQTILLRIVQYLASIALILGVFHKLGWIHRLIWHIAETELSKLLNGAPVTIGGLKYDIWRGRYWASNVLIHSPLREEWQWESPVIGRVGSLYVKINLLYCIFSDWILNEMAPLEIDTIHAKDIQGFVERRQHIFNFYCLDPHVILPNPADLKPNQFNNTDGADSHNNESMEKEGIDDNNHEQQAQKVVADMIRAVHDLGRAAQKGSFQQSLASHRSTITSVLKQLRSNNMKKTDAMQEGVRIAQQVGKTVVKKTQGAQQVMLPDRREIQGEIVVYGRIGRVILEDARVFTRSENQTTGEWNKPVCVQSLHMKAAELCPPLIGKDDEGFPLLYQPLDVILDLCWKRIVAEMAKSNTNRLFSTAMGQVLDFWLEAETSSTATSASDS